MRTKNQTFDILEKFICQAELWSRKKLKHLRTNFEEEFANKAGEEDSSKKDVKWELSAPYTLEQNRKAEPINYNLM